MTRPARVDIRVENHGSIVLLQPLNPAAREWLDQHVAWEQKFGNAIVVEPRYVAGIVQGAINDGLEVR